MWPFRKQKATLTSLVVDYNSFADTSVEELKVLQDKFQSDYNLTWYEDWFYNQTTGLLTFSTGTKELNFRYFDVGSFSEQSKTWKWSWDNDKSMLKQKAGEDSLTNHATDSGQQKIAYNPGTITIAPAVLKKYQEACLHDTVSYDKKFVSNFFDIIKKFNGKKMDTTLLTIGNLDGDLDQDTIFSRVYYDADSIHVDSKWVKNNHVLWRDKYTDPYTELNADLLDSSRNTWVFFGIGVIYGPPDFYSRNEMDSSALSMVYDQGVDDLNRAGIHINKEQYKAYLRDFKGDLLACGEPDSRERLWIWYKPAGRMITYYQP